MENKVVIIAQNLSSLEQYGKRNNLVSSGIPENIPDNQLENTVASVLSDIEANIQSEGTEACYRFGKTGKTNPRKLLFVL